MAVRNKKSVVALLGSIAGMALLSLPTVAMAEPAGAQAALTAVSGTGSGQVLIAPYAKLHGPFGVAITVNVHDASPNTTYTITRYPDLNPDGICTRDLTPPSPPDWVLNTSPGGAGAVHLDLQLPSGTPFVSGTRFDVVWELAGSDGSKLVSECVTVTVK
jgi:hypothetical protein